MAVFAVGGYEALLRSYGYHPSVNDDSDLWGVVRHGINPFDRDQVVLIGASRIQVAVSPAIFAQSFQGRKPLQLAIPGSVCLPVLAHLAGDESFCGIVICDLLDGILSGKPDVSDPGLQSEYVHRYLTRPPTALLERRLRALVQASTCLAVPFLSPRSFFGNLCRGKLPVQRTWMWPDRSRLVDFGKRLDQSDRAKIEGVPKAASAVPTPRSSVDPVHVSQTLVAIERSVRAI